MTLAMFILAVLTLVFYAVFACCELYFAHRNGDAAHITLHPLSVALAVLAIINFFL